MVQDLGLGFGLDQLQELFVIIYYYESPFLVIFALSTDRKLCSNQQEMSLSAMASLPLLAIHLFSYLTI